MKLKRVLTAILSAVTIFAVTPKAINAADEFVINNGTLVSYTGDGGDVVIPDGVTAIGSDAFFGCTEVTEVTVPDGVTEK